MNKLPTHKHRVPGAISVIATLMLALGCSGPAEPDDAGADVPRDAEPPVLDSEVPPPDSGLAPECETGERRTAECGFCGMESQSCEDPGVWMATSECLGQGECEVGEVETRDGALCQQEQRICLDGCAWSDWEETRPAGVCEPLSERVSEESCAEGAERPETCDDACQWQPTGDCVDPCGGSIPLRTSPEWEREVCVPAGNFIRGSPTASNSIEPLEVYISAFYIDAYPVTYRRYDQCVAAGACAAPDAMTRNPDHTLLDRPAQGIDFARANDFCAWDGRRLPTEAEWMKAARGPSPRTNEFLWGDTWDCARVPYTMSCGWTRPPEYDGTDMVEFDFDALPGTESYFGTFLQGTATREWTADLYHCDESWYRANLSDPLCGPGDTHLPTRVARGTITSRMYPLARRNGPRDSYTALGVRCVREVE
ncbi:MAG: hypothetical protein EVA89_09135 [Sandaracinaceae bacterium]|nr:MAG: hypothetical protein EVA89_09135 [Sandaracinaceae bacterium]